MRSIWCCNSLRESDLWSEVVEMGLTLKFKLKVANNI